MAGSARARRFGDFIDGRVPQPQPVKRWDGAARSCADWDNLRRDPELWFRQGNCLVHLYARGQSRRGPSFRLPFSKLLEAKCYPLIARTIAWEGIEIPNHRELTRWSRKNPSRRVDLYIPPPTTVDKTQAFHYHVATRNFFAWVFRRSLVGVTLSDALVGLLHSMHQFREGADDNVRDMMDFLDEEGYLDMANQPNHALAMLNLAEAFHMKKLYTRAFAHAVGMSDCLFSSTEYQTTSVDSRKLIRRGRFEMDRRLARSSTMLKTFLDDELSEAHLAIPSGARAHLERFRSFLLSFYTTKLGYYPPRTVDSGCDIFDAAVYRTMREDFEALYDLLVDDEYTVSRSMPSMAHGGICTIQLVHSFDMRHEFIPLEHPLPLLPEAADIFSRRLPWLPRREKLRLDRRTTVHAALTKASNPSKPGVAQNDLVRAYRRFEEDSVVSPNRADKQEKVSLVDARKVRWILVYAVYQVLRDATTVPVEVEEDLEEANYNLSISTLDIPPWDKPRDMEKLLRRQTQFVAEIQTPPAQQDIEMHDDTVRIEIKPDIDYFALTHKESTKEAKDPNKLDPASKPLPPSRSSSLKRALSRSSTIRRSMRLFKVSSNTPPLPPSPSRQAYHEIVVHGYGNGINNVKAEPTQQPQPEPEVEFSSWGGWEVPAAGDASTPESMDSAQDTIDSPIEAPSPTTCFPEPSHLIMMDVHQQKPPRQRRRDVVSMVARSMSGRRVSKRRSIFSDRSDDSDEDFAAPPRRRSTFGIEGVSGGGLTRSFTRHSMLIPDLRRRSILPESRIREQDDDEEMQEPYVVGDDADWTAMQAFMEVDPAAGVRMVDDDDVMPAWEQYADLGGLTEMR